MGRKKKEDLKAAVYKPFSPDELPKLSYYDMMPEIIETTALGDSFRRYTHSPYTITTTSDGLSSTYITPPRYSSGTSGPIPEWSYGSTTLGAETTYEDMKKIFIKEEIGDVNVVSKTSMVKGEHIVVCEDRSDLSTERILKTLSAVKGKLMLDVAPIHIKTIECNMTPEVRKNIVTASKRLKMYGKKRPIIARFDDYGNRLPDEIKLDSFQGITLRIIDPEDYGDYYLEMRAIEFPTGDYATYTTTPWEAFGEDIPF